MKGIVIFAATAVAVTPVQKVITMMEDMKVKGQQSKEAEIKIYDEYSEWVRDQVRDKNYELETLRNTIAKLEGNINKAEADVATLGEAIDDLNAEINTAEAQSAKSTKIREEEKAEYEKVNQDYVESVDAIGNAINVMQSQAFDRKQASSLLQIVSRVPEATKALTAFLDTTDITQGAPEVAGYEFQSGGIIDLLKKLQKKFREELHTVNRDESNAQHAYDMEQVNLNSQIKAAKEHLREKSSRRAKRQSEAGEFKGELADTQNTLHATTEYLENVETTYKLKTRDYKLNQKVRGEELEALNQAIEIISGNAVKGSAEKHLPSLAQKSFLQLRSAHKLQGENVVAFLEKSAQKLKSKVLQMAALKVSRGNFDKVAKIIRDLISRLEAEAAEEAEHKAFCDKELKDNKLTREEKTAKTEELQTEVEALTATIKKLAQDIAELTEEETKLRNAVKDFTAERAKERETNEATIKDAKEAQTALSSALEVLKAFYDNAGASFVQQVPEMAKYTGQQDSKKGVVGMLEVIASDFARLEADTSSSESQAQREFEEFKEKAEADIESKHKDAFDKGMLKDRKEHTRKLTNKDLRSVSDELKAANDYYDSLKPQCLEVHVSYEERVRLREEEIQALQQAYDILNQKKD